MWDRALAIRRAQQTLYRAGIMLKATLFVALSAVLGLLGQMTGFLGPASALAVNYRFQAFWGRSFLRLFNVQVDVVGDIPRGKGENFLITSNHLGWLDVLVLASLFHTGFLSKSSISRIPIVGPGARRAGAIFIDRESRQSREQSFARVCERLESGFNLALFPAGTTAHEVEAGSFRWRGFEAAIHTGVPVLVVRLDYAREFRWVRESVRRSLSATLGRRPVPVRVEIVGRLEPQRFATGRDMALVAESLLSGTTTPQDQGFSQNDRQKSSA